MKRKNFKKKKRNKVENFKGPPLNPRAKSSHPSGLCANHISASHYFYRFIIFFVFDYFFNFEFHCFIIFIFFIFQYFKNYFMFFLMVLISGVDLKIFVLSLKFPIIFDYV